MSKMKQYNSRLGWSIQPWSKCIDCGLACWWLCWNVDVFTTVLIIPLVTWTGVCWCVVRRCLGVDVSLMFMCRCVEVLSASALLCWCVELVCWCVKKKESAGTWDLFRSRQNEKSGKQDQEQLNPLFFWMMILHKSNQFQFTNKYQQSARERRCSEIIRPRSKSK